MENRLFGMKMVTKNLFIFFHNLMTFFSQILHDDANPRELTEDELSKLQTGPSIPVFDADDL